MIKSILGLGLFATLSLAANTTSNDEEWRWKSLEAVRQTYSVMCVEDMKSLDKVIRAWGFAEPEKYITLGRFGGSVNEGYVTLLYKHPKNGEIVIVTVIPDKERSSAYACTNAAIVPNGNQPVQELPEYKDETNRHNQQ